MQNLEQQYLVRVFLYIYVFLVRLVFGLSLKWNRIFKLKLVDFSQSSYKFLLTFSEKDKKTSHKVQLNSKWIRTPNVGLTFSDSETPKSTAVVLVYPGEAVSVEDEVVVINSIVLPNKTLNVSVQEEIILWLSFPLSYMYHNRFSSRKPMFE